MKRIFLTNNSALKELIANDFELEALSFYEGYCASKHPFFNTKPEFLNYDEAIMQTSIKSVFYKSLKFRKITYKLKDNSVLTYSYAYRSWIKVKTNA